MFRNVICTSKTALWMFMFTMSAGMLLLQACSDTDDPGNVLNPASAPATVPVFSAAAFTNPTQIDNVYFPLLPGSVRVYFLETEDGSETTVVEVLEQTREVLGIPSRVVRDRVFVDGDLIEDTHDWYAQDDAGNVWYMGEEVDNYNYDNAGTLIDITHEGAWEAGQDIAAVGSNAQPGYLMKAWPGDSNGYHGTRT